ncbi:GRB2-associated-binding protein 2 isoform X3 [Oreochromis niloticus]|uniref:GRB2-associated-binding protein 2 isoform X3 n=1 Tax=Oreochromis niloticus TaxID=8128 RepID=UPI000DF1B758|nr:GRB2-associated-binding protein 2 isoform X3 [Oreochromis niloticus]XP_039454176.1 GRB2-associated-binding protein 2 isoform X3 [Oreochromis aureus]CAI5692949.1 unnamed protein product [Mustela putorius furo]
MSGGEIIFQGWLRKSPPEKKLRRYAWKKRWFILRSGRMSGDPDVLEYYKNDHSKKPIRVIDLQCCEQVDAGLTFKRKEFQDSYVFDIKTVDRTFYLVAETEEEMNKWVRSICHLCGFNQSDESHDGRLHHMPRSVGADVTSSMAPLTGERKSSAPVHSSQPVLFTFDVPVRHTHHNSMSNSAPQDYLLLHQCISRKTESARSASFSQSTRSKSAQLHGFYSLPKPGKHQMPVHDDSNQEACYVLPRGYSSEAPAHSGLGSSFETNNQHRFIHFNHSGQSMESVNDGFSSYLRQTPLTRSDSGNSDDNYVPMNPGSSPLSACQADSPKNIYIPMSPGPHHFDFPGFSATLPARKASSASLCHRPSRLSDVTPPPIYRDLKPDRKSKPTPLDLKNNGIIDELPFKSPVTMSWTRPMPAMNCTSSQHCRPISTQSITSTDSADSEENYVAMQNPASTSPAVSGTSSPAPRKCGNVDYLALEFQPGTPNPHRKPSTSSVTSDEKVDYVQVDKEKTQALQNTMQEWTDVRQSTEPAKGVKS